MKTSYRLLLMVKMCGVQDKENTVTGKVTDLGGCIALILSCLHIPMKYGFQNKNNCQTE